MTAATPPTSGPFDAIRVLDLTVGAAGSISSMYLGDFGADVVKAAVSSESPPAAPLSLYADRNKRLVRIDVATAAGLAAARRLARRADVVVVDRPAAWLGARGLDAATLCMANSRLVHLWLPAYGTVGRWSSLPADDLLLSARTGVCDQQPATVDQPVAPVLPYLSYEQGALAAIAVAAALVGRERTGLGRPVTVSGLHAVAAMNATVMTDVPGVTRPFGGPKAPAIGSPTYRMYRCRDARWLFVSALTPAFTVTLLEAFDLVELLELPGVGGDPFKLHAPQVQATVAMRFEARLAERDRSEWIERLRRAGAPHAPVQTLQEWLASETVAANHAMVTLDHADLGAVTLPGVHVELSVTPGEVARLAERAEELSADLWADVQESPRRGDGRDLVPADLPLAGLRVLDLGAFMAGPLAAEMLGELGADVVKVEHPGGDGFRISPGAYIAANRVKRNVCLDLKQPHALDALRRLVRDADVVVDNARAGAAERLGTDYQSLRAVNPHIVRCTVSGWGAGPMEGTPCFDPLLQASSGLMVAQGGEEEPVLQAVPVIDVSSATLGAFGATAALYARARIGAGQEVHTSLTHASLMQQAGEATTYTGSPAPEHGGRDHLGSSAARRLYRCADGWIAVSAVAAGEDTMAASLTSLASLASLALAGTAASAASDSDGSPARTGALGLEARFAEVTVEQALDAMASASVPALDVLGRDNLFQDAWLWANGFFTTVDDPAHGEVGVVAGCADWGMPRAGGGPSARGTGEDDDAILRETGAVPEV